MYVCDLENLEKRHINFVDRYRGPYKSNCRCRDRKKVIINFRAVKNVNGVKSVKKSLSLGM